MADGGRGSGRRWMAVHGSPPKPSFVVFQPWTPGSADFEVLLQWNKSQVYSKTIAYFATRLAGGE